MQAIARSVLACKPIAARAQSASKQTEVVQAERPETAVVIHQRYDQDFAVKDLLVLQYQLINRELPLASGSQLQYLILTAPYSHER